MTYILTIIALLLTLTVIIWTVWRLVQRDFILREHLPLDLCNLSALGAVAHAYTDAKIFTAWMVCIAAPGALVSVITPDITPRHGRATFVKYWLVHLGLVAYGLLAARMIAPPDSISGVFYVIGLLIAYFVTMFGVNAALGANYLFLTHKPSTRSPLDLFGPWPFYLLPMVVTAIAIIMATYFGWTLLWR